MVLTENRKSMDKNCFEASNNIRIFIKEYKYKIFSACFLQRIEKGSKISALSAFRGRKIKYHFWPC